jgi:hypothetical protein
LVGHKLARGQGGRRTDGRRCGRGIAQPAQPNTQGSRERGADQEHRPCFGKVVRALSAVGLAAVEALREHVTRGESDGRRSHLCQPGAAAQEMASARDGA